MDASRHRRAAAEDFVGTPLSVVFTEGDQMEAVRAGETRIPLSPPFHVADESTYLLLPDDIGMEFVDIMRDGDLELMHEAMRDGLLVVGSMEQVGGGQMELHVEAFTRPTDALSDDLPYAASVLVGAGQDPLARLEDLEHLQCTMVSGLLDDEGLDRVLRRKEYLGVSWRAPADQPADADPTCIWSRHVGRGRAGVELALFQEYEELVVLLRPVVLTAAA
ncbi:MAG: hypothetical protein ACOCXM_02870 [Myxococcota bacterium]